ncbi:unnamed protein product [Cylicocyclus nassatus]|uniref:Uncharacterized protein n=1 Tax=Cylicocyclus nassatus TaxID=53992 RepID=A0AA36HAK0_CYLNA|nr:unnamed protein product [Cylicocyclus nassatus]
MSKLAAERVRSVMSKQRSLENLDLDDTKPVEGITLEVLSADTQWSCDQTFVMVQMLKAGTVEKHMAEMQFSTPCNTCGNLLSAKKIVILGLTTSM